MFRSVSFCIDSFEVQRVEKVIVRRIWSRNHSCSLSGSRDMNNNNNNNNNNREEEESSDLLACRISETVSSLVLKLGLHIVVGSSRLDNHLQ